MHNPAHFNPALRTIVNIATDGVPNDTATAIAAATRAHNTLGIDAMTAEAIGAAASGADFLPDLVFSPLAGPCNNCGVLLADGSAPPNPMTSLPWVLAVNSFDDFARVINAKVQAVIGPNPVPEPASIGLALVALASLTVPVSALLAAPADGACTTRDRSPHVAVVVCPPDTPRATLLVAGKAACEGLAPCNAWIREDAAIAPGRAPAVDTDMPKSVTGKARAVWNDGTASLMELRRVR